MDSDELVPLRYNEEQTKTMRILQEYYGENQVMVPRWNEETKTADLRNIEPWRVMSMYESKEHGLFHLHPELVDVGKGGIELVLLCPYCSDSVKNVNADPPKRVPWFLIANGINFGYYKRLDLTAPNVHKEVIGTCQGCYSFLQNKIEHVWMPYHDT